MPVRGSRFAVRGGAHVGVGVGVGVAVAVLAAAAVSAQPAPVRTTSADRLSAAVTIYNTNLGLVREVREFEVPQGAAEIAFEDVSEQIRPETVHVKDLGSSAALRVLEQNYRYQVLAPSSLIEQYLGRRVTLVHVVPGTGAIVRREATLLSVGEAGGGGGGYGYGYGYGYAGGYSDPWGYVYDIDGDVTFGGGWRIVLPAEIPAGFVRRPTLFWTVEAPGAGRRRLEASYLTNGMMWRADYVLLLAPGGAVGDLTGWVTLSNDSGIAFDDASLRLVAGNVNVVTPTAARPTVAGHRIALLAADIPMDYEEAKPQFVEEGMFEYHLYALQRTTDLADREQKQIELLRGTDIPMERHYRLRGQAYWFQSQQSGIMENLHPAVWVEFVNAEDVGLGIPLPAGTVRVYQAEEGRGGGRQFVGESAIRHTAREERVKLRVGEAFDVVAERRQTDYEAIADGVAATEWEIRIRNRKEETVTVEVREPTSGDWTVVESSLPWVKESSREVRFDVVCPPDQEVVLTYRLRVRYY